MLSLSNVGLGRVLRCLRGKTPPSTLDSLRKTCKRLNDQVCSMGFDKLEDVRLTWFSFRDSSKLAYKSLGRAGCAVTTSIGFKECCYSPKCWRCRWHKMRLLPDPIINRPALAMVEEEARQERYQHEVPFAELRERVPRARQPSEDYMDNSTLNGEDPWASESVLNSKPPICANGAVVNNFVTMTVLRAERPSRDHFCSKFGAALRRIRSVGVLKLCGWLIDQNIIQLLINCSELKTLHEVHFVNCVVTITKEECRSFLHSRPIREIHLNSKFKKFSMDDSCLMNIPRVFFSGYNESSLYFGYTGITDNLLNNWSTIPLVEIDFLSVRSNITVFGILNLLKASLATNSYSEYRLREIFATRKEFGILHKATKEIRGANWLFKETGPPTRVLITSQTNCNFELSFDLWIRNPPHQ